MSEIEKLSGITAFPLMPISLLGQPLVSQSEPTDDVVDRKPARLDTKDKMKLFIRTIGISRARVNIAYNMLRYVFNEAKRVAA